MKMRLGQKGFTLIEILMVILLVAILSAVAIPQFVDFRTEARDAAMRSALGALRTGIATQYGQMIMRCNATPGTWPTLAQLSNNDITNGGVPCDATEITNAAERQFVPSATLPENPWSDSAALAARTAVAACVGAGCARDGVNGCDGNPYGATTDGWCYDTATGAIWAATNNRPDGLESSQAY